jgi:hypothetical protein
VTALNRLMKIWRGEGESHHGLVLVAGAPPALAGPPLPSSSRSHRQDPPRESSILRSARTGKAPHHGEGRTYHDGPIGGATVPTRDEESPSRFVRHERVEVFQAERSQNTSRLSTLPCTPTTMDSASLSVAPSSTRFANAPVRSLYCVP